MKLIAIFVFVSWHFYVTVFSHVVNFIVDTVQKQRVCVQFCFKLGKNPFGLLQQAYGNDALSRPTSFEWFKIFKERRISDKYNTTLNLKNELNRGSCSRNYSKKPPINY